MTKNKVVQKKSSNSKRTFPCVSLKDALEVSLAIKNHNGGNPWTPNDVAKAIGQTSTTNKFYYISAASRDYGLTEGTRNTVDIKLTDFGRTIVYAPNGEVEQKNKILAFFNIKVFKDVYDYYGGSSLPEVKYLRNALENNFSIDPTHHDDFVAVYRANCSYLGLDKPAVDLINVLKQNSDEGLSATRIIGEPQSGSTSSPRLFVAIPFNEKDGRSVGFFNEVLTNLITPAGTAAGFKVETAKKHGSDIIQSTIINELIDADLVLADLTDHNPNVLFELGFRIALNKPVVIMKAKGTNGIFDVDSMMRYCEYDSNLWQSTVNNDLPLLTEHIKAAWENKGANPTYYNILTQLNKTTQ
jgi:hypothetical protein